MEPVYSVMILDDEPIVCERLRSTLEKVNLDIETFTNPNEAVKRFGTKKFHVLITDLKMKELDGIEILKMVQKVSPETKVIIITGFATVEKAREALKIGAYDFIAKPFKLSQLRDLVIKALGLSN
ncbi:MAG: response regulator [Thermodesulfobacteriota bacterium]|jgi:DNA-binding NtrC family response regulator